MIRCLIIDDEPLAQKLLEDYIEKIPHLKLVGKFVNPLQAMPLLTKNKVDLVFLDIEMGSVSGMDVAELLSNGPRIIFTTAYSKYAVESYEKNALDYLMKPITFERFLAAVKKFEDDNGSKKPAKDEKDQSILFVKSGKEIIKLKYDDILFIEGMKDYVCMHTKSRKVIIHNSLKNLDENLPDNFIRAHNSWIVNLSFVEAVKDNRVTIGSKKITIGKKYRERFFNRINTSSL